VKERIFLDGCRPEPLVHYLKALGIFRIVAEQLDAGVQAAWVGDTLSLATAKTADEIVQFFLDEYQPTPIVAPWNGGSGFYPKDEREALDSIVASPLDRFTEYRGTIEIARRIVASRNEAPKDQEKTSLLKACRRDLPDRAIAWLDAALVLGTDKPDYPPLLGTGGNDGRLDFTNNSMQRLVAVLPGFAEENQQKKQRERSERQLRKALFGSGAAELLQAAVGQFHPGGVGGANASQGLKGGSLINPWDFVLAIEGTLLFASATVRKLAAGARSRASFPFTAYSSAVGYGTAAVTEKTRAEMWLPLWSRFASYAEVANIFGEGRARFAKDERRLVQSGFDFARAVADLGVDRGIDAFQRIGFLERNGQAYLATSLGRFEVRKARPESSLLGEIDRWLESLRRVTRDAGKTPQRLLRARIAVEEAVVEFCAHGGRDRLLDVLVSLGAAESEVARSPKLRGKDGIRPLARLSERWVSACDDGTDEFAIAAALASLVADAQSGPMRVHLEPVAVSGQGASWAERDVRVVWGSGRLEDNLAAVLQRRSVEARASKVSKLALASARRASIDAVMAFVDGHTDDERIEELLKALVLVHWREALPPSKTSNADASISSAYALLKLLFLPDAALTWGAVADPRAIRYEPAIVPRLRAGQPDEAIQTAARRLRASGLEPITERFHVAPEQAKRLAAALLIPVDTSATSLARRVLKPPKSKDQTVPPRGEDYADSI